MNRNFNAITSFSNISGGIGYGTAPTITVAQPGAGTTAVGIASMSASLSLIHI